MSVLPVSWLISNWDVDSIVIKSSYDLPALLLLPSPSRPRQLCILLQFGVHSAKPAVLGLVCAWNCGSSKSESSGIKNVLVPSAGIDIVMVLFASLKVTVYRSPPNQDALFIAVCSAAAKDSAS